MPNLYLNDNVYDWLRSETDSDDFDLMAMSDLATYVYTATYGGLELEFPVSEEQAKWCSTAADQFVYEWLAASDEMWMLSMQKMLTLLKESVEVVFEGQSISATDVL